MYAGKKIQKGKKEEDEFTFKLDMRIS